MWHSSWTMRLIRTVSLRKCRSLPKAAIPGIAVRSVAASLSFTAWVTNSRNGIPRSAAADLAPAENRIGNLERGFHGLSLLYLCNARNSQSASNVNFTAASRTD